MNCPHCANKNRASAKFCGHCGSLMYGGATAPKLTPAAAATLLLDALGWVSYAVMDCSRCGNRNRPEARFCGHCGAPVSGVFAINKVGFIAVILLLLGAVLWGSNILFSKKPAPASQPAAAVFKPDRVFPQKLNNEHSGEDEILREENNWQKVVAQSQADDQANKRQAAESKARREAAEVKTRPQNVVPEAITVHETVGNRNRPAPNDAKDSIKAARKEAEDSIKAARDAVTKSLQRHP